MRRRCCPAIKMQEVHLTVTALPLYFLCVQFHASCCDDNGLIRFTHKNPRDDEEENITCWLKIAFLRHLEQPPSWAVASVYFLTWKSTYCRNVHTYETKDLKVVFVWISNSSKTLFWDRSLATSPECDELEWDSKINFLTNRSFNEAFILLPVLIFITMCV